MRRFSFLLGAGVAAAAAPAVVHVAVGWHHVSFTGTTHVYTVGSSALVAVIAAVGLTIVGARRGDTRTMVVGTAFAVMAGLLALHGFSTPGVWFGNNGVVAITGGATLPAGAIVLVFSVLPLPRVLQNVLPFLLVEAALLAIVLALGVSALIWPSLLPPVPAPGGPDALALLAVGMLAFGLVTLRAVRTFLLTRRVLDLAVAVGLVWLATALVPALTMNYEQLGWWIGHEVELDGILVIGIAVAIDLARAAQSRPLVRRPHRRGARRLRGSVPRLAGARAYGDARGEGRVHRASHTARRVAGRSGRRRARPVPQPPTDARDRRARPRHRQARDPGFDLEEAGAAR